MSTLAIILAASATAFFAGATFFLKWHTDRPRLHVDDWTIHDRTEFPVQKFTIITELKWGVKFTVKHSAGIPAELLRVEVDVKSPFKTVEKHRFNPHHTEQDGFTQHPLPQQCLQHRPKVHPQQTSVEASGARYRDNYLLG